MTSKTPTRIVGEEKKAKGEGATDLLSPRWTEVLVFSHSLPSISVVIELHSRRKVISQQRQWYRAGHNSLQTRNPPALLSYNQLKDWTDSFFRSAEAEIRGSSSK